MNSVYALVFCIAMVVTTAPVENVVSDNGNVYQHVINDPMIISMREISSKLSINSSKIRLEIQYPAGALPPTTFYYTKTINGVRHAGTLNIYRIEKTKDATYALYVGTIYPVE